MTREERHARPPGRHPGPGQQWAPSLRVVGIERLLEPVARARGHFVHACSRESKGNVQSGVSIALSKCNIWNPKAASASPETNTARQMCSNGASEAVAAGRRRLLPCDRDLMHVTARSQAQDCHSHDLTTRCGRLIHTDQAHRYARKNEWEGHLYCNSDWEFST